MRRFTLTNTNDIELETSLDELALDLRGDTIETNMAVGVDGSSWHGGHDFDWDSIKR